MNFTLFSPWPQCRFEFPRRAAAPKRHTSPCHEPNVTSVNLVFAEDKTAYIDVQL